MKRIQVLVGLMAVVLVFGLIARADNTVCTGAVILVPDGSAHTDNILAGETRFFRFQARANRSYAFMIENTDAIDINDVVFIVSGGLEGACPGAALTSGTASTSFAVTEPASFDTTVNAGAGRMTLKMTADASVIVRASAIGTGGEFRVRMVETTLFSPRWSTISGFETFWGFQNTTNSNLSITLKVIKTDGTDAVPPVTFTVNANTVVFRDTRPSDLNVANELSGSVVVTHNGPPGAIQADAFITGTSTVSGGSVSINVPVKFEPRWSMSGSSFTR